MAAPERRVGREAMRCPPPARIRDTYPLPIDMWRACNALVEGARVVDPCGGRTAHRFPPHVSLERGHGSPPPHGVMDPGSQVTSSTRGSLQPPGPITIAPPLALLSIAVYLLEMGTPSGRVPTVAPGRGVVTVPLAPRYAPQVRLTPPPGGGCFFHPCIQKQIGRASCRERVCLYV